MTAEQILQDLEAAPSDDVVFTTLPLTGSKSKTESPSDKTAAESVKLVEAFHKLESNHTEDIPQTIDKVKKHVDHLKTVLSRPHDPKTM